MLNNLWNLGITKYFFGNQFEILRNLNWKNLFGEMVAQEIKNLEFWKIIVQNC